MKSKTGKLLPLADIEGDEEYFNENYLDGSGIEQLTGNYEDDDEDDEEWEIGKLRIKSDWISFQRYWS